MDIVLSNNSDEPIYLQIYKEISRQIINKEIQAGTQLPPIRTIAKDLRISVIPVKRAWEELDRNGLISSTVGRGTFVAELHAEVIAEKKNQKAIELVDKLILEAKNIGLSKDELIELLNNNYV